MWCLTRRGVIVQLDLEGEMTPEVYPTQELAEAMYTALPRAVSNSLSVTRLRAMQESDVRNLIVRLNTKKTPGQRRNEQFQENDY